MQIKTPVYERIPSIDFLRGLAVVLMVQQHMIVWLWKVPWQNVNDLLDVNIHMLLLNAAGGMAAPLFITIAGFSFVYFSTKPAYNHRQIIVRGLVLIVAGYFMNLLIPSWFTPGSWYVLHMIGFAFIVSPLLKRFSTAGLLITAVLIIFSAALLQTYLDTPFYLHNKRMGLYSLKGSVFRLAFVEGHFPVFPWLALYISGMAAARWVREHKVKNIVIFALASGLTTGLLVLIDFSQLITHESFVRFSKVLTGFYPPLPPMIFLLLSGALFFIAGTFFLFQKKIHLRDTNVFILSGKISLTVLILHAVVFRELFIRIGLHKTFSDLVTLVIIYSFIGGFAAVSYLWQKIDYRGSLEWIMRRLSSKVQY